MGTSTIRFGFIGRAERAGASSPVGRGVSSGMFDVVRRLLTVAWNLDLCLGGEWGGCIWRCGLRALKKYLSDQVGWWFRRFGNFESRRVSWYLERMSHWSSRFVNHKRTLFFGSSDLFPCDSRLHTKLDLHAWNFQQTARNGLSILRTREGCWKQVFWR